MRIAFSAFVLGVLGVFAFAADKAADGRAAPDYSAVKVGVLLYGSGIQDGSEIQEAVLTLLALDKAGAKVQCFAPDGDQADVVDHSKGAAVSGEKRNMLRESARITQGKIASIGSIKPEDLDALVIPGGLGFIKTVTTFAKDGPNFETLPQVKDLVVQVHTLGKPIAFLCITPILCAKLFGAEKVRLTVGGAGGVADVVKGFGAVHVEATARDIVTDEKARIVSSPAYMVGPSISAVGEGIGKAIDKVLEMALKAKAK